MTEAEAREAGERLWAEASERAGLPYDVQDPSVVARAADFLGHSRLPTDERDAA